MLVKTKSWWLGWQDSECKLCSRCGGAKLKASKVELNREESFIREEEDDTFLQFPFIKSDISYKNTNNSCFGFLLFQLLDSKSLAFDAILLLAFSKVVGFWCHIDVGVFKSCAVGYFVGIRSKFVTPLTLHSCHTAGKTQPIEYFRNSFSTWKNFGKTFTSLNSKTYAALCPSLILFKTPKGQTSYE